MMKRPTFSTKYGTRDDWQSIGSLSVAVLAKFTGAHPADDGVVRASVSPQLACRDKPSLTTRLQPEAMQMINDNLLALVSETRLRAIAPDPVFFDYVRKHGIDIRTVTEKTGPFMTALIKDHGSGRFDFEDGSDGRPGFVCVAYGADGTTPVDLVGWHLANPSHVMSLLGRCGFLGLAEALNPLTYLFDTPLVIHRTPLEWLQAGCEGAAIVTPRVVGWQMVDVPGRMAARDHDHGNELIKIARSIVDVSRIVVPARTRRVAA